ILFKELFYNVNLYTVLIIGVPLYGVVTTYLFNREYMENTLKNILTIPVSRIGFIVSKMLLLFIWIMMLTRSEEHTCELQSRFDLVCRLLLEKKNIR